MAAFQPVVPFLVTGAASMGAYAAGLALAQARSQPVPPATMHHLHALLGSHIH